MRAHQRHRARCGGTDVLMLLRPRYVSMGQMRACDRGGQGRQDWLEGRGAGRGSLA